MDGIVIGGCGHGQTFDPDKVGPVLCIPKPIKLAPVKYADYDPITDRAYERQDYKLHRFASDDGQGGANRWRVWMPIEVKPHQAMEYLITMAAKAPKQDAT